MLGILRHPTFVLVVGIAFSVLLVGSVVPTPTNWTRDSATEVLDIRVTTHAQWHPLSGTWTLEPPTATAKSSPWINWGSIFHNALSLTSQSERFVLTLEGTQTSVTKTLDTKTGKGGLLGSEKDIVLVFREVEPDVYTLRAQILNDAGTPRAESTSTLRIIGGT